MSRHRFMKDIAEDEDYGDDYDNEVYDVYDMVVDAIPDITHDEIYDALLDFDFDVDETTDYFLIDVASGAVQRKRKGKKKGKSKNTQAPNTNQTNNNNQNNSNKININNNQKNQQQPQHPKNASPNTQNLTNTLKSLNIKQPNNSNSSQLSSSPRTPANTPNDHIEHLNKSNSSISTTSTAPSLNTSSSSLQINQNVKQHSLARQKELEKLVHDHLGKSDNKTSLNMVVIGHVDAGKSTTMGHLLFDLGCVDKRTMAKFEKEAAAMGKGSFAFAWVLDEQAEERSRGVTMDVCVRYFETQHRRVTLLDAPGHRDFVPNMISGATQADVAILLINASEFEAGFCADGQTREHAVLAKSLGIVQLIVAINKMDVVVWDKERYEFIVNTMTTFLTGIKFSESNLRFIPISGFGGDNLVTLSSKCEWYRGPTLVQLIDTFSVGERLINKPFRMGVNDLYKSSGKGTVLVGGKVEAGVIGIGDKLLISPGHEIGTVKAIKRSNLDSEWAIGGDNVDLSLNVDTTAAIRVGSILCDPERPIQSSRVILAQIVTFSVPTPITTGYQAVFHAHSMEEPATITKLISLMDNSGGVSKKNPRCITDSSSALIEITLHRPACLELYSNYRQLGRFTLREGGHTIAAGIITEFQDQAPKQQDTNNNNNNNNNNNVNGNGEIKKKKIVKKVILVKKKKGESSPTNTDLNQGNNTTTTPKIPVSNKL